jgi:N6-L-threonylcarbamoyladenine synthase
VALAGGVAANLPLRQTIQARVDVEVRLPPIPLCTDNAAMIGAAAYRHLDAMVAPTAPLDIHPTVSRKTFAVGAQI